MREQRDFYYIFLLQGQLSVLTLISVPVPPQYYRSSIKDPGHCQKCYKKLATHVKSHASTVSLLESGE